MSINGTSVVVDSKETYLWKAKLAQEANRYEDMAKYMKLVIETGAPTAKDEDNMLAVAYKRVLDMKRSSRRTLLSVEQKDGIAPWEAAVARRYRSRIDGELRLLCTEMLNVVRGWLSSDRAGSSDPATDVFYWKLRGDYGRYAAEATYDPAERTAVISESRAAYEQADQLGREKLRPVDPVRLGLMLNYSVFLYQVCQQRQRGHDVAKRAYENAVNEIDNIDDNMYYDSTLILRLIRDNLTIWIQENGGASFDDENNNNNNNDTDSPAGVQQAVTVPISSVTGITAMTASTTTTTTSSQLPPPLPATADITNTESEVLESEDL